MAKRISIVANPVEPITVDLVGVEYVVEPPKAMLGIIMAQKIDLAGENIDQVMEEMHAWLRVAMGGKQAKKVMERLNDMEDKLDISHVSELMKLLTEEVAGGNPTT